VRLSLEIGHDILPTPGQSNYVDLLIALMLRVMCRSYAVVYLNILGIKAAVFCV
jgi:hypothetical protein